MNPDLERLFSHDSAVIMIDGRKGFGKTDFALKMGEDAIEEGLIKRMATNMRTEDERVDSVTNLPDLKDWMHLKGDKYFILDEAGKIIKRMRFMAQLNILILELIQLARHWDCKFTAIAPSTKFIDSNYLNTDILDCRIKKISLTFAEVKNILHFQAYTLDDIERTTIKFWSKDTANFTLKKPHDTVDFSPEEKCAHLYSKGASMMEIGASFTPRMHRQQVARLIQRYLNRHFAPLKPCHKSLTRVEV